MAHATKTLTFDEETDLIAMAFSSIAYMKHLAAESNDNKTYWMDRAEQYKKVAKKLYAEMRQTMNEKLDDKIAIQELDAI